MVTFNGARFDLPFIKHEYPEIEFDQLHVTRSEDTTGITGFDAVWLWHEYERGRGDALPLLLKCNRRDVVDLETIIELLHPKFVEDAFSAAGGSLRRVGYPILLQVPAKSYQLVT